MGGFHADLLSDPIQIVKGRIQAPTKPGLGADLNEDLARENPYQGNRLHLEMLDSRIWTGVYLPGTNIQTGTNTGTNTSDKTGIKLGEVSKGPIARQPLKPRQPSLYTWIGRQIYPRIPDHGCIGV